MAKGNNKDYMDSELFTKAIEKMIVDHPHAFRANLNSFSFSKVSSINSVQESRNGFKLIVGDSEYNVFFTVENANEEE